MRTSKLGKRFGGTTKAQTSHGVYERAVRAPGEEIQMSEIPQRVGEIPARQDAPTE